MDSNVVKRKNHSKWDDLIKAGQDKISRLEKTVRRFKQYRDSGVTYPGNIEIDKAELKKGTDLTSVPNGSL